MLEEMNIKNYTLTITSPEEKGQNYFGIIAQAKVDNRNTDEHYDFIIKSAPQDKDFRKIVFVEEVFQREIYIYSQLHSKFAKLQNDKNIKNPFNSYPKYYASIDKYNNEAIILQNMFSLGYKHWNREKPLDANHLLFVMRELGKYHALSYAARKHGGIFFEEIVNNTQEIFFQDFKVDSMRVTAQSYLRRLAQVLDRKLDKTLYEKVNHFTENVTTIIAKSVDSKNADQYAVVTHGDCALNNFLFKYEDSNNFDCPTGLCFLDWQASRFGSPALDISCFLFTSMSKIVKNLYQDLIKEYYRSLCCMLTKFEIDGTRMLPFFELQNQLRRFSVYGLFIASMVVYLKIYKLKDMQELERQEGNVEDVSENAIKYNTIMRDVLLLFEELDYNFN
ncbi:hypothetical protein FQA39_LY13831 [Lamprigera yunnana]|nr:hypothetical protein FQA39_LY13831 [Lamprigera yunnana]